MSKLVTTLAARIRQELEATRTSLVKAIDHAITVGELLIEAKQQVRHGDWLPWLAENCEISERTAQSHMKLARTPLEKRNALRISPLREALAAIANRKRYEGFPLPVAERQYAFEGHEACSGVPCNCGVDYVAMNEHGEIVGRMPVNRVSK